MGRFKIVNTFLQAFEQRVIRVIFRNLQKPSNIRIQATQKFTSLIVDRFDRSELRTELLKELGQKANVAKKE